MQRYQDVIDRYLTSEIRAIYDIVGKSATVQEVSANLPFLKITSLLNGKYIILGGEYPPVENRFAMGHAWFVENFVPAETPDDEITLIGSVDLSKTAVIGNDFEWAQKAVTSGTTSVMSSEAGGSPDHITLTSYAPN